MEKLRTGDPDHKELYEESLQPECDPEDVELMQETEDEGHVHRFTVPESLSGKRLDVAVSSLLPDQSRSFWQRAVSDGLVRLDGEVSDKPGLKVSAGQSLEVTPPEVKDVKIEAEYIPLDILYEDNDLIVVNKPKGMVVHPAPGHYTGTLVNALMYHCRDSLSGINGSLRPGIVHRIDRDTTGSVVAAKNDRAHISLASQLKEHSITRKYRTIVYGNLPEEEGVIDAPIGRHPQDRKKMAVLREGQGTSRRAVTHYRVLERFGRYTYAECVLETGRTHQIRVHMAYIGHPVLGDAVYGPSKPPFALRGQTLHAMTLGFIHPSTGQYMEFEAPLPEYFERLLDKLRNGQGLT